MDGCCNKQGFPLGRQAQASLRHALAVYIQIKAGYGGWGEGVVQGEGKAPSVWAFRLPCTNSLRKMNSGTAGISNLYLETLLGGKY